jgi:predicted Rossmann-fold nucleotide-binding protein
MHIAPGTEDSPSLRILTPLEKPRDSPAALWLNRACIPHRGITNKIPSPATLSPLTDTRATMKQEIDSQTRLDQWFLAPKTAIFQGMNLTVREDDFWKRIDLTGSVFLGCKMTDALARHAATHGCLIVPEFPNLPFNAFSPGLYSPDELYDHYDPKDSVASYEQCLDRKIYVSYIDTATKKPRPADVDVAIARRIHDASIAEALDDLLDLARRKRCVAIMGGHDFPRDQPLYRTIAQLCLDLTSEGYFIVTGGGPGLMEAANLGAYCTGFTEPSVKLDAALEGIRKAPRYDHKDWLSTGYTAWKGLGTPDKPGQSRSLGIPTWFYGHEPPNVFATDIAKYFENSVREEGLLAIALAGVVFAQGNAGTVQELFQDACQNYYATYDDTRSPMVLFDTSYWSPSTPLQHHAGDKRKPAYELVEKLAIEKGFIDRLLLTDSTDAILKLIRKFSPLTP